MNIKKILITLMLIVTAFSVTAYAKSLELTIDSNAYSIKEGESIISAGISTEVYTVNGRTMVPVRLISETFEASVGWDEAEQKVTVNYDDKNIVLYIGNTSAYVNGAECVLDVAPVETNGTTMVPIRFIMENLNCIVKYVPLTEQVVITNDPPVAYVGVNEIPITYETAELCLLAALYGESADEIGTEAYIDKTIERIALIYTIAEMAENEGYYLPQEELDNIKKYADEMFTSSEADFLKSEYIDMMVKLTTYNAFFNSTAVGTYNDIYNNLSEENLQDFYSENFFAAKHILISKDTENAEKKIKDIKNKLSNGYSFDELMYKYTEDPGIQSYPEGYAFTYGEMVEPFEKAVEKLQIGKISGIVETDYGYHIIKRIELPELSDEIKDAIITEEVYKSIDDYEALLMENTEYDKLYTTDTFIHLF